MYNYHHNRRAESRISLRTRTASRRTNMCRPSASQERKSKRQRSPGNLRKPSWGGLAGLGSIRRIENKELREMLLPRRPASVDLPTTTTARCLPRQPKSLGVASKPGFHNQSWEISPNSRPQKKLKKLKLLEELQKGPLKTREEMNESKKWKALDDIVDMAYKIRVSDDYNWDKLLEEDVEEEDSDYDSSSALSPHQQRRKVYEKPSIHLHYCRERNLPTIGPGILLV
mmetsp:Transcript_9306/g.23139  ORF Transcript_9306/g.23139 Transcript_9306/m.23139 type:complete len:228 (+) Transcript_9306:97-780(+)